MMIAAKLTACGRTLLIAAVLAIGAGADALAQTFDVNTLPRPEGAEVAPDRNSSSSSVTYVYPANVSTTIAATEKALSGAGCSRTRWSSGVASSAGRCIARGR